LIVRTRSALSLLSLLPLTVALAASAGEIDMRVGGAHYNVAVTSLEEARFRNVVRQQYDFSCGSAALATLLTYHYGIQTAEADAFDSMWREGDQNSIRSVGFSMLDMKRYLETIGYRADGFRIELAKLEDVGVPAIALINTRGYNHFVVVTGVQRGRVMLADPSIGLRAIRRGEFEKMWNGILFMVRDGVSVAQANFNRPENWKIHPTAPIGTALSVDALGAFTVNMPPGMYN
jgi:predicted double-glycine peptidase